jgi:hypothetical protein
MRVWYPERLRGAADRSTESSDRNPRKRDSFSTGELGLRM